MKRRVAQLEESKREDYDPEERGEVTAVGEHHGGSFGTYFAHKVTKLRQQHQPVLSGDKSTQIFRGCIMYVNGLTELPIEELRRLISLHGGEHIMYRAVKITHYVCNHFTDAQLKHEYAKVKLNARNKVHNVTVAWVLESIQQMKRLNENLYVPKGLSGHGAVLTKSFFTASSSSGSSNETEVHHTGSSSSSENAHTTSMKSSTNSGDTRSSIPVTASTTNTTNTTSTTDTTSAELTSSQEAFLESIPEEFREDALLQIASVNRAKVMNSSSSSSGNGSSSSSSGSGSGNGSTSSGRGGGSTSSSGIANSNTFDAIIDLYNDTEDNTAEAAPSATTNASVNKTTPLLDAAATHRRDSLHSMVYSIHYTEHNTLCTSKVVMYNMKEYIHTLIASTTLDTPLTATSSVSYMVVQLLTDYATYLKGQALYEQVKFLLSELKRQCTAADATADIVNNSSGTGTTRWCDIHTAVIRKVKL